MVVSINIDETVLRPNVRPAKPKSKRGPVTFFVDIEAPNGRSVKRNLTRGVNDLDDDFTPTPQPPVDVSLQTLLLSLNLSSTFYWDTPVAFDPVTADFFLQQFEVGVGGNIDVPGLELSVDMETTAEAAISRAPIIVDLTLPQFTTNKTITFEPIDIGLSLPTLETEAKVETSLDIITVDLTVPALNTDIATNFEALSLSMSLPDAEIASDIYGELAVVNLSVAGTLDTGININLPASMESAQDDDVAIIGEQSLLLDTYSGAAAAYSVRKLSTSYTGSCMKVRRDDGVDTGTDIGFDVNGNLNTADIAAHCGTDNGYVVTWYDQSGNGNDATQTTAAAQPQIYNGTAVLTDNGKPKLSFDGSNDWMQLPDAASVGTTTSSWLVGSTFMVGAKDNTNNEGLARISSGSFGGGRWEYGAVLSGNEYWGYAANSIAVNLGAVNTNQKLYTSEAIQGGNASAYINGSLKGSVIAVTSTMTSGGAELNRTDQFGAGRLQEVVIYRSEQSSNRTGIESNINAYYSIY